MYYGKKYYVGRDALHSLLLKQYPASAPTRNQVARWLKKQTLQQRFALTRKSNTNDGFVATTPWRDISIDLVDFSQRSSPKGNKYGLIVVDNFSRFMYSRAINAKEGAVTARAFRHVLDAIERDYGKKPKTIITDDGGEFKKDFARLCTAEGIKIKRTIGGNPQANGMVERANGKVKLLIGKGIAVEKKHWTTLLPQATKTYNNLPIRSTGYAPAEAVKFDTEAQFKKVRSNVQVAYGKRRSEDNYGMSQAGKIKAGDHVRRKVNQSKLHKQMDGSWSKTVFTVANVRPARGVAPEKYTLVKQGTVGGPEKTYLATDLQKIDRDDPPPVARAHSTRQQARPAGGYNLRSRA